MSDIKLPGESPGWRVEAMRQVNRVCPECGKRWLAPGDVRYIEIERCAAHRHIRRDEMGRKV